MAVTPNIASGDPCSLAESRAPRPDRPSTVFTRPLAGLWQIPATGLPQDQPLVCGLQALGLCANLRFCDESADSQAVPQIAVQTRVNQLRNKALGRLRRRCNIPAIPVGQAGFRGPFLSSTNFSTGSKCLSVAVSAHGRDGACPVSADRPAAVEPRDPTRPLRRCLQSGSRNAWNCEGRRD
jgi:hypothetical protein